MANLTAEEMETHLNMSADDRSFWHIASNDVVMQRRVEKVGATLVKQRGDTKFYTLPANQVSFRNKSALTDEQRAAMSERARAHFAALATEGDVQP